MTEQQTQLKRVEANIAEHVRAFLASVGGVGTFRNHDLEAYVHERVPAGGESPLRIMRKMRANGEIICPCIGGKGLYRFDGFREPGLTQGVLF